MMSFKLYKEMHSFYLIIGQNLAHLHTCICMYWHVEDNTNLRIQMHFLNIIGAKALSDAYYQPGNGLMDIKYMDDVKCTGSEENLLNCTYTLYESCWYGYASVNCTVAECSEGQSVLWEE